MHKPYDFNMSFFKEEYTVCDSGDDYTGWGGPRARLMLQTLSTIAFLCLLRLDEALSTTWDNVHFERWENTFRARLELTVHNTHQYGGMYFYRTQRLVFN